MRGDEATSAFAGDPQPVEVYHRGIWYLGELLGWRHESGGRCLARVRCVVDGLRHSAWKDLADLRLPEPIGHEDWVGDEQDSDATRPHVLMADLRTRPRPPAHAVAPPRGARLPAAPQGSDGAQPNDVQPNDAPNDATATVTATGTTAAHLTAATTAADEALADVTAADAAAEGPADVPAIATVPPARRGDGHSGDWAHLRRGGRLSRI